MLILTIKTDKPEAEAGLYQKTKPLAYERWQAHRLLAETLHLKIAKNLQFIDKDWKDIEGIVVFRGPGSFTGLRIGLATANALAQGLEIPIVGEQGNDWIEKGQVRLMKNQNEKVVLPEYGAPVKTTTPK